MQVVKGNADSMKKQQYLEQKQRLEAKERQIEDAKYQMD